MRLLISATCFLVCASSLGAQITSALTTVPGRSPELEIRNESAANLAAFVIRMSPNLAAVAERPPFTVFVDTAIDPAAVLLSPGQVYRIPVPSRIRPKQAPESLYIPPVVVAGVFEDGQTTGDASLVARLILRRCNMLQAVETSLDML